MRHKIQILIFCTAILAAMMMMPTPASAQCNGTTHVVQTGENLFRIGLQYGLTWDAVAAANGITNPNAIYVTQVLCIPTGGVFGTGGPTTTTGTSAVIGNNGRAVGGANTTVVGGPVEAYSGQFIIERAANSIESAIPAGTIDPDSGFATTATVGLDASNNLLHIQTGGMIPNSQVAVHVSDRLGSLADGHAGYLLANNLGVVDGYVEIPFISRFAHQYVMIRSYDGRMTFGFFDLGRRFP